MSEVIFRGVTGLVTQGVILENSPIGKSIIYIDSLANLLGFRSHLPYTTLQDGTVCYDVGHFLGMLYEGIPEAFNLLYAPEGSVLESTFEYELIHRERERFLSQKLTDTIIKEVPGDIQDLVRLLKLRAALAISEYTLSEKDSVIVQSVIGGNVDLKTSYNEILSGVKEIDPLRPVVDIHMVDDLLLQLRQ